MAKKIIRPPFSSNVESISGAHEPDQEARPAGVDLKGAPHDFSADPTVSRDALAAAGLRNGMPPQDVHDALHAIWKARGGHW